MKMRNGLVELYNIISQMGDYLVCGFKREHTTPKLRSSLTVKKAAIQALSALRQLDDEVVSCRKCPLGFSRLNAVFGIGPRKPQVMVIGEAPGAEEDRQGLPFVGKAGQYLDKWLNAIGLSRTTNAYIANVLKCRPPDNRDPQEVEISACSPFLVHQIKMLEPRTILTVSRFAVNFLLGTNQSLSSLRGRIHEYAGIPLVATYHPSAVLRSPDLRPKVWEDIKLLGSLLAKDRPNA